jgi:AraC-like DNA-binding protein
MHSQIWRVPRFHNLELLSAFYRFHHFAPHWHDIYVIQIVEHGVNELLCNGKSYFSYPGTIVLINPGEVHTGSSRENHLLRYRSFYFTSGLLKEMMRDISGENKGNVLFISTVISDLRISNKLLYAHRAIENKADILETDSLLHSAFCKLLVGYSSNSMLLKEPADERSSIFKVQTYLRDRFAEKIGLIELAKISGLSSFHLLRSFRKVTGLAPFEFLRNVRVERARELLSSGYPIVETAMATGFCDQSHLNRHFKKVLGITPGQYRAITSKTVILS